VSVLPQRRAHVIAHLREAGGSAAVQLLTAIVSSAHNQQQQQQQLHAAVLRALLAWLQLSALTWSALYDSNTSSDSSSSSSSGNGGTNSGSGSVVVQLILHSLSSADEIVSSLACEAVTALAEASPTVATAAVLLPPLTAVAHSLLSPQQQQQQQQRYDVQEVTAAVVRTTGALAACCSAYLPAHTAAAAAAISSDASTLQHWRVAVAVLLSALQAPSLDVVSAVVDFWSDVGTACIAGACSLQQEFVQALQLLLSRSELPTAAVQVRAHVQTHTLQMKPLLYHHVCCRVLASSIGACKLCVSSGFSAQMQNIATAHTRCVHVLLCRIGQGTVSTVKQTVRT
jgi:hypothetical protein